MTSLFQQNEACCESMCSSTRLCGLPLSPGTKLSRPPRNRGDAEQSKLSIFGHLRLAGKQTVVASNVALCLS